MNQLGYLDVDSIEHDPDLDVWTAFYMDQDGGELGHLERDDDRFPETYEF